MDEEDETQEEAEQVKAEDTTNARRLQTICAIKRRVEEDKGDAETMKVSQWHQEVREQ